MALFEIWVELDVTAAVSGAGTYSFALTRGTRRLSVGSKTTAEGSRRLLRTGELAYNR